MHYSYWRYSKPDSDVPLSPFVVSWVNVCFCRMDVMTKFSLALKRWRWWWWPHHQGFFLLNISTIHISRLWTWHCNCASCPRKIQFTTGEWNQGCCSFSVNLRFRLHLQAAGDTALWAVWRHHCCCPYSCWICAQRWRWGRGLSAWRSCWRQWRGEEDIWVEVGHLRVPRHCVDADRSPVCGVEHWAVGLLKKAGQLEKCAIVAVIVLLARKMHMGKL